MAIYAVKSSDDTMNCTDQMKSLCLNGIKGHILWLWILQELSTELEAIDSMQLEIPDTSYLVLNNRISAISIRHVWKYFGDSIYPIASSLLILTHEDSEGSQVIRRSISFLTEVKHIMLKTSVDNNSCGEIIQSISPVEK